MNSLFIAFNYIRRHIIKFLLITFALALMISSVIFTQIFSYAENYRRFYTARQDIVPFSIIFCDVDNELLTDSLLSEHSAGRQDVNGYTVKSGARQYIGYMDEVALASLNVKILRGRLPENENELAMSDELLSLYKVSVGDMLTLTVTDKTGEHEKEFFVSGMTSDFFTKYTETEVFIPQMSSQENFDANLITIPSIISGKSDNFLSVNMIKNVIDTYNYPIDHPLEIGQKATIINNDNDQIAGDEPFEALYDKFLTDVTIKYVVPLVLIVAMLAGIYTAVKILARGQDENIRLIKIIGSTNKQAFCIFFYEAVFISLLSSLLSVFSGLGICSAYSAFMKTLGVGYKTPVNTVFVISVASFLLLLVFYIIYFAISIKNKKTSITPYRQKTKNICRLWYKTLDKNSGRSKTAFRIVVVISVIVFSAGCLWADYTVLSYASQIESSKKYSNDYLIRVPGGTYLPSLMYYDLPSGCGVSRSELEELYKNYPVDEKLRVMHRNIHSYADIDADKHAMTKKMVTVPEHLKDAFIQSGLDNPDKLCKYGVKGVPYEYLDVFLTNDIDFSKEDYDSGKIAISVHGRFKKGDTFKLSFMTYPEEINEQPDNMNELIPDIKTIDVNITHTQALRYLEDKPLEIGDLLRENQVCIVLSDNYLLSLSDSFKYDYILLDNAYELSSAEAFATDEYIANLADENRLHLYNNYIYPMLMKNESMKQKIPYIAISSVYMAIVVLFAYICINCEVRSREREFLILKSMGAEKKHLIKIISYSALKKMLPAIPVALVFYLAFYVVLFNNASEYRVATYLPAVDAIIYPVIITAVITAIVLIASVISAMWAYKRQKQNVE